jgi:hypothetical protein
MQIAGGGLQKKKVEDMPWSSLVGVRKLLKELEGVGRRGARGGEKRSAASQEGLVWV